MSEEGRFETPKKMRSMAEANFDQAQVVGQAAMDAAKPKSLSSFPEFRGWNAHPDCLLCGIATWFHCIAQN